MDYRNLSSDTWKELDNTGNRGSGYKSIWLSDKENQPSDLHIFIDEESNFHYAIQTGKIHKKDLYDPEVNGLDVDLVYFRLGGSQEKQFIDLKCSLPGFLEEFSEVVKEISKSILGSGSKTSESLNTILRKWKSFWSVSNKNLLSLERQIGLYCELQILDKLCEIKPDLAFEGWEGPLGKVHDFRFSNWDLEIKGTTRIGPIHRINGINQLDSIENRKLLLISYLLELSDNETSSSLPDLIDSIIDETIADRPDLILKMHELLGLLGYNPIHAEFYQENRFNIISSQVFLVDDEFPCLNKGKLKETISSRISDVNYDLSFGGLESERLEDISWGDYFY